MIVCEATRRLESNAHRLGRLSPRTDRFPDAMGQSLVCEGVTNPHSPHTRQVVANAHSPLTSPTAEYVNHLAFAGDMLLIWKSAEEVRIVCREMLEACEKQLMCAQEDKLILWSTTPTGPVDIDKHR